RYLFRHKRPPPSATIAIGASGGESTASFRGHPLHVGPPKRGRLPTDVVNGYVLTFTVGRVVFHVVHTIVPNQRPGYGGGDIAQVIQWLWPVERQVLLWTPRPAFDEDAFVAFADAGRP